MSPTIRLRSATSPTSFDRFTERLQASANARRRSRSARFRRFPFGRSVTPDHIVCLEDGKKLKMLRRHLKTAYNMTPEEYRERWNLPPDYPMVAPNYAAQRSELARKIGLGRRTNRA